MKLTKYKITLIMILMCFSSYGMGNVLAQTGPNTNFETGDTFHFKSDETRSGYWTNRIVLANDTNPNQIFRYEEHTNEDYETVEGDADIFLVKPGTNLPTFTSPDGDFDHLMIVDWEGQTVDPSNRTWWRNFLDGGDPGCQSWCNETKQVEDTTGRHHSNREDGDDDERAMPIVSNSTYLLQLSEMTDDAYGLDIDDWKRDGELDLGSFNGDIPLIDRTVSTENGRYYRINDVDHNIDTRIVYSHFEVTYLETFASNMNFGDPNDPSSSLDVDTTVDIYANYIYTHYFDDSTGMLLEIQEDTTFSVDITSLNGSYPNPHPGPTPLSLDVLSSFGSTRSQSMVIDSASSFYGNSRPESSGSNRIEEGMLMVYETENENSFSFDADTLVGDPSNDGWESYDSRWGNQEAYGTIGFDVYRHQPGGFDVVMFMEGTSEGEWGYDESGTKHNQPYSHGDTSSEGPRDYLDWDYMSFQSSDDEEIAHFFDDKRDFDDDFLYDDRDDWRLDYDRSIPKDGSVNDSTFHIHLEGDEVIEINGHERTWFDVQMYGQNYVRDYNEAVQIPISRDHDQEIWITVQLTGSAEGSQEWFYDDNTGVLVRMEQRVSAYLILDGNQNVDVTVHREGQEPMQVTMNVDFHAEIEIKDKFAIMLTEHPVEYDGAEPPHPHDHSTDSSTSTTSSTTSTSETDDDDGGADLPIPIPFAPIMAALGLIAVISKRRR